MRVDALFRLIMAMFFASLPLILAIQRGRRRHRAGATTKRGTRAENEPIPAAKRTRRNQNRIRRFLRDAFTGETDGDLREIPSEHAQAIRPRRRRAFQEESGKKRRLHDPSAEKASAVTRPKENAGKLSIARARSPGEKTLARVERLPVLQRAIVYQELFGPPRGLGPPGSTEY